MGDGVKDPERHRQRFPKTNTMAAGVDERHLFIWSQSLYCVVRHEDDNVIVHCIARKTADGTWQMLREPLREENFNPCAYVHTGLDVGYVTK